VEVKLSKKDPWPEQELDEDEIIERIIVPLKELYDTLIGNFAFPHYYFHLLEQSLFSAKLQGTLQKTAHAYI
jgi:hypothetical protein